jgi:hypothetical protein
MKEKEIVAAEARDLSFSVAYKGLTEKDIFSKIEDAAKHGRLSFQHERPMKGGQSLLTPSEKRLLESLGYKVQEGVSNWNDDPKDMIITTISWE